MNQSLTERRPGILATLMMVEEDVDPDGNNEAAVIKGSICSEDLYKQLNRSGGRGHHGVRHHDD